ncbi:TPA: phage tail terminator protein [Serratia marcescens]
MSSGPFDVSPVIDRLRGLVGVNKPLRLVGNVAEYTQLTSLTNATTPSAYVLLGKETPNDSSAGSRQSVRVIFGVVTVVRAASSSVTNIESARVLLNPVVGAIRDSLIGWRIPGMPGSRPVSWVGGETLDFQNGVLVWMDMYQTQHFIGGGNE